MQVFKKDMRYSGRKTQIWCQFLVNYLIVFLVPLIICSAYYLHMIRVIGADDMEARQMELEHSSQQIDTMLKEFANMGDLLTSDPSVNAFKRKTESVWQSPNTYRLNELRDALPQFLVMNQNVVNYFIFFDKSNLVINDRDIYTWEDFYNLYLHPENSESFEEWKQSVIEHHDFNGVLAEQTYLYRKNQKKQYLCYSRPLIAAETNTNAFIWILFDHQAVMNHMPMLENSGIEFITNSNGELLYYQLGQSIQVDEDIILEQIQNIDLVNETNSKKIQLGTITYSLMKHTSPNSGLTYCTLYPDSVLRQRMLTSAGILLLIILSGLVAGIILSVVMSRKTALPINDILSEFSRDVEKNDVHGSVFDSLKKNFTYLAKRNSDLSEMIERQKPYLRNSFLTRILYSNTYMEDEILQRADYIGLEYRNKKFVLLIFNFEINWEGMEPGLVTTFVLSLLEAIDQELPGSFHASLGNNQVVLLMSFEQGSNTGFREEMEKCVEKIKAHMPASISDHLYVYGSRVAESLTDLYQAYRDSDCMVRYGMELNENIIDWFETDQTRAIIYPADNLETKLAAFVFAGDQKGLHDELEKLMKEWVFDANMSGYMQQMLFAELQLILIRMLDKLEADEKDICSFYERLENNMGQPLLNQIPITLNLYRDLCDFVLEQKKMQGSESVMASVTAYIDTNYMDCGLSLVQVADLFSISESALSTMFKNTQGVKFSSYVEGVRISKAKELLESTSLTVSEISEKVGYTSANSFCRAFRRVTGINTSEYRKK